MRTFFSSVVRHPKRIFILFILAALAGTLLQALVKVNYDMKDYLPADSPSTTAINVMDSAFGDGIPNARVLIEDVSIPEALAYKDRLGPGGSQCPAQQSENRDRDHHQHPPVAAYFPAALRQGRPPADAADHAAASVGFPYAHSASFRRSGRAFRTGCGRTRRPGRGVAVSLSHTERHV